MADPATAYTRAFVLGSMPEGAQRILEVGCGDGALAARLQLDGFATVALDSDEEAVALARRRGVDARRAAWPDFADGQFDAVLFTRSLHHVGDLAAGVAAAFACLTGRGRVIVEDFDFDFAHEATLEWFAELVRGLAEDGRPVGASPFLAAFLERDRSPLEAWRAPHHHPLHGAAAIEAELRASGPKVEASGSAYFFRYVAKAFPGDAQLAEKLLREELDLIERGRIEPLGRRFVA